MLNSSPEGIFSISAQQETPMPRFQPIIIQEQQQISREDLARSQQAIAEMQHHYNTYQAQVNILQNNIITQEDAHRFSGLLLELNRCRDSLNRHIAAYNELVSLANVQFASSRLSDQAKREIYHLYHSGRWTQIQLAGQYGVQQSTISKIVNGQAPT